MVNIKNHKLYLSVINKQLKIAKFLLSLDSKIEIVESELKLNKEFKNGLLQGIFLIKR